MRHFLKGLAGITTVLAVASPAVWIAVNAGTDGAERGARTAAASDPNGCPAPFPVDEVTDGMTGWGLTVGKGTTPEKFTVTVQGVLKDGIAPGIDLILAEAQSPALDKAGAIWAGMSGSPVYAEDGRLLGAVGYGFSGSSTLAGITPAQAMYDILSRPGAASARTLKTKVKLPGALRQKVTSRGLVKASAAEDGLGTLPMPRLVSGLGKQRISKINGRLAKSGSPVRLRQAASAGGGSGSADEVIPGGNFGVLMSYGTVTAGGIGTTTAVCDGRALAFGHPMQRSPAGPVRYAAVSGSALAVVKDPTFGAFKLANFGGVVGTVDQDRLSGVAARLGAGPAMTPITVTSTATTQRTDKSYVANSDDVPIVSAYHLWSSLDRAFDQTTGGNTTASWKVRGTSDGKPFELTFGDRYADMLDASGPTGEDVAMRLAALQQNPYTTVKITDVVGTAAAAGPYREYTAAKLLVKSGKRWVVHNPRRPLKVTGGRDLVVRVRMTGYRLADKDVDLKLRVPKKARGTTGTLSILGGPEPENLVGCSPMDPYTCAEELRHSTTSFTDLLTKLRSQERGDVLSGDLALDGRPVKHVRTRRQLNVVVGGDLRLDIVIG